MSVFSLLILIKYKNKHKLENKEQEKVMDIEKKRQIGSIDI